MASRPFDASPTKRISFGRDICPEAQLCRASRVGEVGQRAPVEDTAREAQIIASAIKAGKSRGLDEAEVSNFFRSQIEANKLIQYSLLAEWRGVGRAPDHTPVDLAGTIRPELEQLGSELIPELTETADIRPSRSCRTDVAKAVGKYVSAHKNNFIPLKVIALDRAMAATCI
jgi:chorismate mutase